MLRPFSASCALLPLTHSERSQARLKPIKTIHLRTVRATPQLVIYQIPGGIADLFILSGAGLITDRKARNSPDKGKERSVVVGLVLDTTGVKVAAAVLPQMVTGRAEPAALARKGRSGFPERLWRND